MFRAIMAQILVAELAKHHAVVTEQSRCAHFAPVCPTRRAIGFSLSGFPPAPDRHCDGNHNRNETAGGSDIGTFLEDVRGISVEAEPPPKEGWRRIDPVAKRGEPWCAKLCLIPKRCRRPLGCTPDAQEHNQKYR
jgi:hypothetical protein